jgi:integrase-like protein
VKKEGRSEEAPALTLDLAAKCDLREAWAVIESWRQFYNHHRPHSALGYLLPSRFRGRNFNIAVHLTVRMATNPAPRSPPLSYQRDA